MKGYFKKSFWLYIFLLLVVLGGFVCGFVFGYLEVARGVEYECRRVISFYKVALGDCVGVPSFVVDNLSIMEVFDDGV